MVIFRDFNPLRTAVTEDPEEVFGCRGMDAFVIVSSLQCTGTESLVTEYNDAYR